MSAADATHENPFVDHDFGGDAAHGATPDHVEPYASREDAAPRTSPVTLPDHVEPYASRDDAAPRTSPVTLPDHVEPYASRD